MSSLAQNDGVENTKSSNQDDLCLAFVNNVQLPGLNVQAGSLNKVGIVLTTANYAKYIKERQHKDLYFVAGVDPLMGIERARDVDIRVKNHFYIDFDIRVHDSKVTDEEIKALGIWLEGALADHPFLCCWRYIVFTGNGLHIHYFGDPVALTSVEQWKEGMKYILNEAEKHTKIEPDWGCINVARLCRIPGSFNNKDGKHTKTEMLLARPSGTMDIALVEKFGEELMHRPRATGTRQEGDKKWRQGLEGVAKGGRNGAATALAGRILHDLPEELWEAAGWGGMKEWNALNTPPLPESELRSTFDSIAKREKKTRQNAQTSAASQPTCEPVIVCVADVEREEVSWLWKERIPLGKLTMMEGDPGHGKSFASLAIACAVTLSSPLPGDEERSPSEPAKVLLLTAEDGAGDTIRPRLEDMGADLARVNILTAVRDVDGKERHFSLEKDLASLEAEIVKGGYALVVIDPLNAYLGATLDTHRDAAVRSVLTPLSQLAERHHIALLCIRHLTKSGKDKAMYRGQGSIAYTAAARAVHLVGLNPNNKAERVIVCIKNSLASFPPSLAFEINEGRFFWKGETDVSAAAILGPEASEEKTTALDEAKDFLRDALASGPRHAKDIWDEAEGAGIAESTLKRAKKELGILTEKVGGKDGFWIWKLPDSTKSANQEVNDKLALFDGEDSDSP